jgi:2-aminobenzoylacetyl-CoA thioesterase
MLIDKPGWITDRVLYLGTRNVCSYLVKGERCALIGGNVAWEVPRLEAQLDQFNINPERITHLVISHAHHDHCGAVPYFQKRYPHIRTVASEYGAYIFGKDKAVDLMRRLNRQTLAALGRPRVHQGISLDFEAIPISLTVGTGDSLDLGEGLVLQFYQTPGHTRCSISTYIPAEGILFPADAVPYPESNGKSLTVTANHDYDDYIESLKLFEPLAIRYVGYEHGGVLTGTNAETIIPRGLAATRQQRQRIVDRYEALGDLELLTNEIAGKYMELDLFRRVPPDTMRAIIDRMVRSALGMV